MVFTLRFFSLQNAICFIILTYLVPALFTFYIQGVLKLKKNNSGSKRLSTVWRTAPNVTSLTLTWQFVYATLATNCLKTWQGLVTDTRFLPDRRGALFLRKGRTRTYKGILITLIPTLTWSHLMSFVPTHNVLNQKRKIRKREAERVFQLLNSHVQISLKHPE
jgi:hypothetical protein